MKILNRNLFAFIFVILIGLTPLLWFKGNMITGEEYFALDYGNWGEMYSSTWGSNSNYGDESIWVPFRFQGYFFIFLKWIGLNSYASLVTWNVFLWMSSTLAFFFLLKYIFKDRIPDWIKAIAAVFYTFNPYFLNIPILYTPPRLQFLFLPIILLILYRYVTSKDDRLKSILLLGLVSFVASPIYVNIPTASTIFIPTLLLILFINIVEKKYLDILKHLVIFIVITILFNAWWMIPTWWKVGGQLSSIRRVTGGFITIDRSPVNDVISYFGSWAFRENAGGLDYFPYYKSFDGFPLVILRYIPFIAILIAFYFFKKNYEKNDNNYFLIFITLLFWISLFMAKGTSGFAGGLFMFLYKYFPMIWIYREPYAKFIPLAIVSGSILLPYGLNALNEIIKSRFKYSQIIFFGVFCVIGLAIGYPYWNNQLFAKQNNYVSRSPIVNYPDYWKIIDEKWKPSNGYYITFPSQAITEIYLWPSGYSGSPYVVLKKAKVLNVPAFLQSNSYSDSTIALLYEYLIKDPEKFVKLAPTYNISGIIFQGDTAYGDNSIKQAYIKEKYQKYLAIQADKVDIYEFNNNASEIAFLNKDINYNTKPTNMLGYRKIKQALNPTDMVDYIESTNDSANVFFKSSDLFTTGAYSYKLDDLPAGPYDVRMSGDLGYLKNIVADTSPIKLTLKTTDTAVNFKLNINKITCCNAINLDVQDIPPVDITKGIERQIASSNNLPIYIAKMDDYDLSNYHSVLINFRENLPYDVIVGIVQIDNVSGNQNVIGNGLVKGGTNKIQFTTEPTGQLDMAFKPSYVLTIQPAMNVSKENAQIPLNITSILTKKIPYFSLVFKKDINTANPSENPNELESGNSISMYKRISKALAIVKIDNINKESILQFKESYDPRWVLYKINDNQTKALQDNILSRTVTAFMLATSKQPANSINIEGYSNGWNLNAGETGNYAILYRPEYITNMLMGVAYVLSVFVIGYIFIYKRK